MASSDDSSLQGKPALLDAADAHWDAERYTEALPLFHSRTEAWPAAPDDVLRAACKGDLLRWDEAEASTCTALELEADSSTAGCQLGTCIENQAGSPRPSRLTGTPWLRKVDHTRHPRRMPRPEC